MRAWYHRGTMEKTIFSRIIDRELPAEILYEDDRAIAILDRFPGVAGQTLVIPKNPTPYLFDLADEEYVHLLAITKKIAAGLDRAFSTLRTCVVVEGFEVPHAHIRLYPLTTQHLSLTSGDMASDEELAELGRRIRAVL